MKTNMSGEMNKTWIESHIYTEEQQAIIAPNENQDGIILSIVETADKSAMRLYLTYQEAIDLANELLLRSK